MINPRERRLSAASLAFTLFCLLVFLLPNEIYANIWQAAPCDPDSTHEYTITFPADASANCDIPDVDTIEINEIDCALLAIAEPVDEFFSASGDECYKIRRTYRVINWYEYDGESAPVVIGRDEDCDGVPGDEAIWVIVRPDERVYLDRNGNEGSGNEFRNNRTCDSNAGEPSGTGFWSSSDFNTEIESRGFWEYSQFIKVYDNVDPTLSINQPDAFCSLSSDFANSCPADVSISFNVADVCTPDDISITVGLDAFVVDLNGDGELTAADFTLNADVSPQVSNDGNGAYTFTGNYPLGRHMLLITAEDGCGNAIADFVVFEVVDCKAPAPICINGLAVELSPIGDDMTDADGDGDFDMCAVAIWASDFMASPVDDCTPPIKYSINRVGESADMDQTGIVLTQDDDEATLIEIYAWDSADNPYAVQPDGSVGGPNYDFCETYVLVQDNNGCIVFGEIAGIIATENSETVANVSVSLSGASALSMTTAADGVYSFPNVDMGTDFSITPELDENHANGVSTFDLVLISKHILGVADLDSPYKMIAADVNNSKSITTLDLIFIQKLILQIDTELDFNTSWRFIDAAYSFPDPTNPWLEDFPEVFNVNNIGDNIVNANFVAIKVGDVNGSASAN